MDTINSLLGEQTSGDILILGTLKRGLPSDARSSTWEITGAVPRLIATHARGPKLTGYEHNLPRKSVAVCIQLVIENGGHGEAQGETWRPSGWRINTVPVLIDGFVG